MITHRFLLLTGSLFFLSSLPATADALMGKSGWQPAPNANRAAIASLMMQHDAMMWEREMGSPDSYAGAIFTCGGPGGGGTGGSGGSGSEGTAGGSGGGGNSNTGTATANNNCTIVVGSKGTVLDADQISDGDQTSTANSEVATNSGQESLSSILEGLE